MLQSAASRSRRRLLVVASAAAVLVLVVSAVLALGIGPVHESARAVIDVVARRLGLGNPHVELLDDEIVWQLRFPRILGAVAVGAGLGVSGAVLQCVTRNSLADPYLLGVSEGATVGAVSVIVLGLTINGLAGTAMLTLAAFAGALGAVAAVFLLATDRTGQLPPARTVLAGVAVGQVCTSYTSFVVLTKGDDNAVRSVLQWTMGSLAGMRWSQAILLLCVVALATGYLVTRAQHLDALAFGETSARALGVSVNRLRWSALVICALMTACLVAYAGVIGFVGLVVPHLVRLTTGPRHRTLLPLSALLGAILMIWADTVARTALSGSEIPVGIVTALVGGPFFVVLLRREGRQGHLR